MKNRWMALVLAIALMMTNVPVYAADELQTPAPADDNAFVSQVVDALGGGDGLFGNGINGIDIYDYLGYVYMGWRTTGGLWQNHIIGDFIMRELGTAGYKTTDEEVEAPYGSKPASDKSDAEEGDHAWMIKYQETEEKELGTTWDPEFSSLTLTMVKEDGTVVEDAEAQELADGIGGTWWAYNPMTETYQKYFAEEFGMDYEKDLASLESTDEKIQAMHNVLMSSDKDRDSRTSVDDYTYIRRESIDKLNKEADLNKRTRLSWESDFTDPPGTDPSEAVGLEGELLYVGTVDPDEDTNSEGIPSERLEGAVIVTDSTPWDAVNYAVLHGCVGIATVTYLEPYLHPKDEEGNILEPWYDSSRYSIGAGLDYREWIDVPEDFKVIDWQFSYKQRDYTKKLLAKAQEEGFKVYARQVSIGQTYPMTKTSGSPGEGQAVAIAEIKGRLHPEKRVLICAHVQEPGCGDNATGVAALLGMATQYKKMIDEGKINRPDCTVTFMWGDEMNMGEYWMDGHPDETSDLIAALDMDMVGEDPEKTGGCMKIEKTPDPSAEYPYTRDEVPWNEPDSSIASPLNPYYDKNYMDSLGRFIRLPDSHTIWGSGSVNGLFKNGFYLNDLYMYVANTVIDRHDQKFRVEFCPFEGGSDHETFLERNIPALLAWHFTDYTYHTSSDTLYMASPRELESVSLTTLTTALMMADMREREDAAMDLLAVVREAALNRLELEGANTDHHVDYVEAGNSTYDEALQNEKEVLAAWGEWYYQAVLSVMGLVDEPSETLIEAVIDAMEEINAKTEERLEYAKEALNEATKVKALEEYRLTAQKELTSYVKTNSKYLADDLGLGIILDGVDAIGAASDKAGIDSALKAAKSLIAEVVKAKTVKVTGLKVTFKKNKATTRWKKSTGVSGYQVSYKLKTAKNWKTLKTTKGLKAVSKKLKKGKKYQFKVRAYTTIQGKKVYGPYTKVKTVKCK